MLYDLYSASCDSNMHAKVMQFHTNVMYICIFVHAWGSSQSVAFSEYTSTFHVEQQDYTCQLFLRYKCEIFILGVLGTIISENSRRSPKFSEEVRSLPKTFKVFRSLRIGINASSLPVLFTSKIRDRGEGIVIYSFYTWFSFLTWVWVNIFLEIVSSKTATTHIFQSGVRNWPAGVSRCGIEVFNLQA